VTPDGRVARRRRQRDRSIGRTPRRIGTAARQVLRSTDHAAP